MIEHRPDAPQPDPIVHDQPGACPRPPDYQPLDPVATGKPDHEESPFTDDARNF